LSADIYAFLFLLIVCHNIYWICMFLVPAF